MWKFRRDSSMPYQEWTEFRDCEKVEVANIYGDVKVGSPDEFWWGYELDGGFVSEGVIVRARSVT